MKKLGRIPLGGGHRVHGRLGFSGRSHRYGYDFIHSLVDDHSRLAYSEVLSDEQGATSAGFLRRAIGFFAAHGIQFRRLMTDNAFAYRLSRPFQATLAELGIQHRRTPPRRPQPNGKVERFNRTLLAEWAYLRPYASNDERVGLLAEWLHGYNYHRGHTASGMHAGTRTAAHRFLPFGTHLRVTNLRNRKSTVVVVVDRGPFTRGRVVDVSASTAEALDFKQNGVALVRVETTNQ